MSVLGRWVPAIPAGTTGGGALMSGLSVDAGSLQSVPG